MVGYYFIFIIVSTASRKRQIDANHEYEYNLWLAGGFLTSTHWLVFDSKSQLIGHTRNNEYDWYTETEFLEDFKGCSWLRF
jgi:hypothetical protein